MPTVMPAQIAPPIADEAAELAAALRAMDRLLSPNALPPLPGVNRCPGAQAGDEWVKLVVPWLARQGTPQEIRAASENGLRRAQQALAGLYNEAENNRENLAVWLRNASNRGARPAGFIRIGDITPAARVEVESDRYCGAPSVFDLAVGRRATSKAIGVALERLPADSPMLPELKKAQPVSFAKTDTTWNADNGLAWTPRQEQVVWLFISRPGIPDPIYVATADACVLTAAALRNELVGALS